MSSIAAHIRFDGGGADRAALSAMAIAMAVSGSAAGVTAATGSQRIQGGAGFAFADAHIPHPAPQPLASADGAVTLVFDGYLSNYSELRADLTGRGAALRTAVDAELVLHAYAQWGADFVRHLDGEFALILWDERRREALCARDHHGLRPLYWHWDGRLLVVGSDIAAVLAALPRAPAPNLGYLAETAADVFYSPHETVWQGIFRLLPAHVLHADARGPRLVEYWTLPTTVDILYRRDEDYFEHYREVLSQSIRRAARSDAPLACEVSGGLDSSSIYCLAHRMLGEGRLPAPELRGYTLSGLSGSAADETSYAQAVGLHTQTRIAEYPLFLPPLDWFARRAAQDRDLPPLPNAAMTITMDKAAVADGCRVSLTGIGGDQWLDGTHYYYSELFAARQWSQLLACYAADVRAGGVLAASGLFVRLGPGSLIPPRWRRKLRSFREGSDKGSATEFGWINPAFRRELAERRERYEAGFPDDYRASYKLRKLRHPSWSVVLDQAVRQRAHTGLEMRSPMMSRAFIEFSARTPEHLRLRGGISKYIQRQSLAGILPPLIANRQSKAEFSIAFAHLARAIEHVCVSGACQGPEGLFDTGGIGVLFHASHNTPIDERCYGEIWGTYASMLMIA